MARRRSGPGKASSADGVDELITEAVRALSGGDRGVLGRLASGVTDRTGTVWALTVRRRLAARLRRGVTRAWERGWQPADVVRLTSRRLTARHARLATDVIAGELRAYPAPTVDDRWQEQLGVLGAEVWWRNDDEHPGAWCEREGVASEAFISHGIELVHLLEGLPRLPKLGPLPGSFNQGQDESATRHKRVRAIDKRTLGKVRALLAKAESTEFPEEAEALSARAQELMARHSIDHALLVTETGDDDDAPDGRRIAVDNPYEAPKAVLLTVVADANHCKAVWHRELGFCTVVGYPADLAAVEMLFTSLLVQATSAMVHAGPRRDARGRSRTRSFRHAFLNAYAARIGERLGEAAGRAAEDAGGNVLVPVLAARGRAVDRAVGAMFPRLARGRAGSVSNYEGWVAGRAAADLAGLNGRLEVTGAYRRS